MSIRKAGIIDWKLWIAVLGCAPLFPAALGQFQFQRLKSFGVHDSGGQTPNARVIEASDGRLYGTTSEGGSDLMGTVFTLFKDGSAFGVLHSFSSVEGRVASDAALIEGRDGSLYGTTMSGGIVGNKSTGTIFQLRKDGSSYTTLHDFSGGAWFHLSGVIQARDGKLYGATSGNGEDGAGDTIFEVNEDGSDYAVLRSGDIGFPRAPLLEGSDGALYGVSYLPGAVFKLNKDGSGYRILHGVSYSSAALIEGSDGALYGTSPEDGTNGRGAVFKLNKDGSGYAVLHSFDLGYPTTALREGADGALYGVTAPYYHDHVSLSVFRLANDGNDFTIVHDFYDDTGKGVVPVGLIQASDGKLYGTTENGGAGGVGTVFKMKTDGANFALVHEFVGDKSSGDPVWPNTPLREGSDGTLYGTSRLGGSAGEGAVFKFAKDGGGYRVLQEFKANTGMGFLPTSLRVSRNGFLYGTCEGGFGVNGSNPGGTVFKLSPDGSAFSVVRQFGTTPEDGKSPRGLVEGSDGLLYGTTSMGGRFTNQFGGSFGLVFKLAKDGNDYRVLHEFGSGPGDGALPQGAPIEGSDGRLYGTTMLGGIPGANYAQGMGTVFSVTKDGSEYAVLHRFSSNDEGVRPGAELTEGSDGTLYGTAGTGAKDDRGMIYSLSKDGSGYSVLHRFGSGPEGGWNPIGGLVEIGGALYGTTSSGGSSDCRCGTVFKLNKDGSGLIVLHSFSGLDGSEPVSGVTKGTDGALYGATEIGGDAGSGTLFALRPQSVLFAPAISFGAVVLRLSGMPGSSQLLQKASRLDGSWLTLTNVAVPVGGIVEVRDAIPSSTQGFYRSISQ